MEHTKFKEYCFAKKSCLICFQFFVANVFILKFRQASNHCKRVLEAAKLAYANKTKESITSQKLDSCDF